MSDNSKKVKLTKREKEMLNYLLYIKKNVEHSMKLDAASELYHRALESKHHLELINTFISVIRSGYHRLAFLQPENKNE